MRERGNRSDCSGNIKRCKDYINQERVFRAANLLLYSDLSLADISEYVHFPTQSYFGKIFKQLKGTIPKAYRDQFLSVEATDPVEPVS